MMTDTPRVLSKDKAAAYCGCETMAAFDDWVRRGIVPGPIPGTRRWDKRAIDMHLDRLSGIEPASEKQLSPYQEWKAAEKAAGRLP
jgi:hypothetical protein